VALLLVGGSSDLESAEALVLLGDLGELGADEQVPYCFSEGDLINGGAVIVEAVPAPSEMASM